jgi:(4S)-4-hydroxy-5-phosphonooxypentane-2,3-dione isomerase
MVMHRIVHIQVLVKPEFVEAFIEASRENARNSVLEPGIARFEIFQQADDPTRFVFIEMFRTPDAQEAHRQTPHYQAWREAVAEMMAEPRKGANYVAV